MRMDIYKAKPIVEQPLLDQLEPSTLVAWFRCNSCLTCEFREKVIDPSDDKDIRWCSRSHEKHNIVDMVRFLGYSKE